MRTKRNIVIGAIGWLLVTGSALAQEHYFVWEGGADASWDDPANWTENRVTVTNAQGVTITLSEKTCCPGPESQVRIGSSVLRITNDITVGSFKLGVGRSATVTIDGGTLTSTGTKEYNSASYNTSAILIITNGGSAVFKNYFMVGFRQARGGIVKIYDGTLRVENNYIHNHQYAGTEDMNTRTIVYQGGLLDVDTLVLNSGILDVAGGTVVIRGRTPAFQVKDWIQKGKIIAMSGTDGWTVRVQEDPATAWITLTAEPPSTVGFICPALSRPAS